jgi:4-amino-4-deoxy-L-arabinose transferase-like glycosyltransferase
VIASARRTRLAVVGVVLLAAGLRVWGLDLGLPGPNGRPDEREILSFTSGFARRDFNPHWFVYPNLFFFTMWAWIQGVLRLLRFWQPLPSYATLLSSDVAPLLLAGRSLSAVVGTATVWATWRFGWKAGGTPLGLASALLLATSWLHVRDSHALKTEALLAAGVLVSVWRLARYVEQPGRRTALTAGIAIGLTMGFKYPGVFLLLPAWLASVWVSPRRGLARGVPSADFVVLAVATVATFVLTNPFLFLEAGRTTDTAAFLSLALYATRPEAAPAAEAGWMAQAWSWFHSRAFLYHATVSLRHGVGLLATLALPIALLRACRRSVPPLVTVAAAFVVAYYPVAGASPVHLARYMTPLTPLIAVLVAYLLVETTARLDEPVRALVRVAAVLLFCAEPFSNAVRANAIAARTDTRVQATAWMATHVPRGARVAHLGGAIVPIMGEPILPPGIEKVVVPPGASDLGALGITHVVTQEHPLPFSVLDPVQFAAVSPRLVPLARFSPWADATVDTVASAGFEREDAYYIPYWNFRGVERPGPLLRVWAYR